MHRVELKVEKGGENYLFHHNVPNAPCGVESLKKATEPIPQMIIVPNAPCGVESKTLELLLGEESQFLMHRVELKA
jgi:hypothetical protein